MSLRNRKLLVAAMAGAAVGIAALAGVSGAHADGSTIDITYTSPTTLQVKLSTGQPVTAGSTIPAGSYNILVFDAGPADTNPELTISGPGVSLDNNLNSSGMGIDQTAPFGPFAFQTSSSYSIEDKVLGASTLVTFATSATATASAGGPAQSAGTSYSTGSSSSSSGSKSSSGSMAMETITATVAASGKPSLMVGGKAVVSLMAGRYRVTVADRSKKAGLLVGKGSANPVTLSGVAASGTSSHVLTLTKGRWYVEGWAGGPRRYFQVV